MADAEGVEEPAEGGALAPLERVEEVLRALLSHPLEAGESGEVEAIEVGSAFHQARLHELRGQLVPQALDVHPPAAGEVLQAGLELRRTVEPGAAEDRPVLVLHRGRAADRAAIGEDVLGLGAGADRVDDLDDLRDDVARAADEDLVTDPDVLALQLQRVVERGPGDGHAAHLHRGEEGDRGERPGAAHVHLDGLHLRPRLLGGELVGHGPARALADLPQPAASVLAVQLHHHAVHLVGERVPAAEEVGVPGAHSLQPGHGAVLGVDREAHRLQPGQLLRVALEGARAGLVSPAAQLVGEEGERPGGGDARVQLAKRAGRGVPGVHVERLALLLPPGVEPCEVGAAEEDLASHLHPGRERRARAGRPEREWHHPDGAEVRRDVLPHRAVPAGGALDQLPVHVDQLHRKTVELGLTDVGDVLRPEHPVHPGVELDQLLVGERVGEAEHRDPVCHRPEPLRRGAGDSRGGRVGGAKRRKLGLEGLELADQDVVLGVRQLRVIQDVVAMVGPGDLCLQRVGSGSGGVGVHG